MYMYMYQLARSGEAKLYTVYTCTYTCTVHSGHCTVNVHVHVHVGMVFIQYIHLTRTRYMYMYTIPGHGTLYLIHLTRTRYTISHPPHQDKVHYTSTSPGQGTSSTSLGHGTLYLIHLTRTRYTIPGQGTLYLIHLTRTRYTIHPPHQDKVHHNHWTSDFTSHCSNQLCLALYM